MPDNEDYETSDETEDAYDDEERGNMVDDGKMDAYEDAFLRGYEEADIIDKEPKEEEEGEEGEEE